MSILRSLRTRVVVGVAVVLAVVFGYSGWVIANGIEDPTPPDVAKTLEDNGDGTYTLSLSVTGRANSSSSSSKADVIVVLDRSGSMNYDQAGHSPNSWQYSGPSRLSVAKNAVNDLAEQLLANNTADDPDRVQLSLVTFSNTASNDITGTTSLTQFQNRVNSITANGGTNWEDGLHDADTITTREGANVYVIFVSDGNPTYRNTKGGTGSSGEMSSHSGWEGQQYYAHTVYGSGNSDNNGLNFRYALVQAQNIVNGGKTFYSIGAFGDASNMQNLATQSGALASNYYDATDQTALNAAFANIINEITNALGYKSVKIEDGLTSITSALVRTNPDTFTYTRSGGSYGDGQEWAGAPTASYADGKVTWDLGDMLLENGVTYTVSFKVWPSQEAYDLVSDLNNGLKTYDSLTAEQKAQIVGLDGGGYGLKTNTDVEFAYTQIETRTTNQRPEGFVEGQPAADGYTYTYDSNTGIYTGTKETTGTCTVDNPDPMPLTHSKLRVTKTWEDSLDPNQRPDEVKLHIKSDDNTYVEVTLNEDNNWTQEIDVAPGLIAEGETLETGHDYTIEEVDPDFHFELDADPFHPMIIDGVLGADDESGSGALVTATNVLKSRLNITKTVEHSADTTPNPDQLFTYKVKVTDIKGDDVWFSIGNSSGPIDVSDENRVTGATVDTADSTYYTAASGTEFTVKIKGGENIFFNNLPTGSTYEVEEVDVPSAYTCTVTNSDSGATTSGNKTSGSITKANTQYNVAYKNAYKVSPATATIPVTKALSIPAGEIGPDDITGAYTFTLTADGNAPLPDTTTATNPDADGGTVSFGDITYTKPGTYTYHVSEAGSVDGVTNDPQASKTITVVVTDKGDGTLEVKVNGATPTADDAANTTFTNSYATTEVSAQIPVTKTLIVPSGLTGPGDITGAYTFTLAATDGAPMPASGGEIVSNPAATGGTASFGAITFTEPGEYAYTITESGSVDGVTNDATATKTVTVTVTDDAHGHLSATIKGADSTAAEPKSSTTFTNTYDATPTTANIPVKKVLNAASGLTPPDITGAYTFTLAAADGTPMPDVTELTNPDADGGTVTFGEISFNRIGTYTYTITESGNVDGVTNDNSGAKTVIVTVTDNGKGKLSASVSVSANNPVTFTNTYTVKPTTATVPVTKVLSVPDGLTGPSSIKEAYTFRLIPQNGAPAASASSVRNPDADGGTASFGAITFTEPGTYTYKITETGTVSGVTNDPAAASGKTVTIKVADNGDGTLTSTVVGADGTEEEPSENTTFTNTYTASGSVELEATKIAEGFKLEDGQFSFELRDADDNVRQTKQNDADGNIKFDAISYSAAGTYTYTISEVVVDGNGIAEDTHTAKVTVTVVDNGDGTLTATPTYEGATFTNTHTENEKDVVSAKDTSTSVDGELVEAGDILTYTITYANNTSDTATVTVTDAIPTNTTYVDGSASAGGVFEGGTITWTIEGVAAGATGTVTFQVTVNDDAGGETIENTANVSDGQNESSTNAVTTSVPVKDVKDADDSSVDGGSTQVGDILTYEVSFTLTEDATSVVVTDDVPDNTTLVDGSISDSGSVEGGTITWDLGALKAGAYTVSFKVMVDESAVTADAITNTASISVNNHSEVNTNTTTTTPEIGGLTISKTVEVPEGIEIDTDKVFSFTVSLADKNGNDLTGEYSYTGSSEGTITNGGTIQLKHGESVTIEGLPAGAKYSIAETAEAGYTPNQATIDGTISKGDEAARAEFINTYAVKPVNVSFPVEKVLNAASGLTPPDITGAFTFTLTAPDGTPMPDDTELTNPDADGGTVTFGDITYTTAGTYTYTVTESGTVAGVTNDAMSAKTVTVIVTDNGDGTLSATASSTEDAPLTFTNSYVVNPTTATIAAQKVLEHADLAAGAFNFELSAADGVPMPSSPNATNAADGTVAFGEITYSTPGTYTYSVKETAGSAPYFDYDGSEKTVTVEVVDNGDGTLTATVTGDGEDATFTNTYKADSDEVFINAVKNVNGEAASQNIFEFTITADDGGTLPDETTVTNNGGSVTFGPIKYDAGIFDEGAPEPAPEPEPGRGEQDSEAAKVNVTLAPLSEVEGENVSVQLMADGEPSGDPVTLQKDAEGVFGPQTWSGLPKQNDEGNDVVYTATYSVDGGDTHTAEDSMLSVEDVETVAETSETEEPSKAAAARTKVFHYTITETAGGAPGYTYDGHSETVTVTVTDNGDGTLATKVAYDDDGAVFDNTYEASGEATIEATKVLTGAKLDAGQFEFGLFEGDTQVGEAVTNGADGAIAFTVPYVMDAEKSDVGTHTYIMRELVGTPQTGYTYDSSSKTVTVKVTDNGDGTLATEATYDGDMTFTNTYKPLPTEVVLEAEKILNGRDLADGEFSFQVTNKDGKVVSSGTNDASGMISFSAIPLTKAGTYTFTAYEVKGDDKDITYDEATYTYTVVVEDQDGQLTVTDVKPESDQVTFTNTYTPPEPAPTPEPTSKPKSPVHKVAIPQTGDVMASPYPMVLLGIAVVAILAGILVRKRNSSFNKSSKRGDTSMRK